MYGIRQRYAILVIHRHYSNNTQYNIFPVAQRCLVTSDTLGREFDPGKRDFSHEA